MVLPDSLEARRGEFQPYVDAAKANILTFAKKSGWEELAAEAFFDSAMIFDEKRNFDHTLLVLAGMDTTMQLPDTYCAALEQRTLIAVSPEYYDRAYPDGREAAAFEKLLTHEIAHRLHIRILHGDEEAMGPVWFYEGFAIYAAGQFSLSTVVLTPQEMIDVMTDPERGSYVRYNYVFRYFVDRIPLRELVTMAGRPDFNEKLIESMPKTTD